MTDGEVQCWTICALYFSDMSVLTPKIAYFVLCENRQRALKMDIYSY